ncbi:MAG: nucleotidyltransferase family protein [Candidatus Nanohaloarchaea archaeon]
MKLSETEKQVIVDKLEEEGATKVEIFGSYARNEAGEDSDIDILVEFSDRKSLVDTARIERELSRALEIDADLVTEDSLSPLIAERIENTEVLIA